MQITIIIPTLNPCERIFDVIDHLCSAGFDEIIVVNDGSDLSKQPLFEKITSVPECKLLTHSQNYGKGKALKTAMQYYMENNIDNKGIVTCDDDGQHCIEDILHCASSVLEHDDSLILGVRNFESVAVPFKSKMGNLLTREYMKRVCRISVSDTQTGLRGIPNAVISTMLDAPGTRFEYETNMILQTKKCGIPILEVPVSTVYIENNRTTRFHPIKDSVQIYLQLAKFSLSSILSFLVDILCFMLICKVFVHYETVTMLFLATVISRFVSAMINYFTNKQLVFRHRGKIQRSVTKYYALCVLQGFVSFVLVALLTFLLSRIYLLPVKILVDFGLFLISFFIQKHWVFKH